MFTFAKQFFKKYCILAILTFLPWLSCHFQKRCLFCLLLISFCWYLININVSRIFLLTEPLTLVIIWDIFMSSMSTCMVFVMKDFVLLKPFAIGVGQAEPRGPRSQWHKPWNSGCGGQAAWGWIPILPVISSLALERLFNCLANWTSC